MNRSVRAGDGRLRASGSMRYDGAWGGGCAGAGTGPYPWAYPWPYPWPCPWPCPCRGRDAGAGCAEWITPSGEARAPDRSRVLDLDKKGGALAIRPLAKPGPSLLVPGRSLSLSCRVPELARWSPDGQRIAVTCEHDPHVYVLDAKPGDPPPRSTP